MKLVLATHNKGKLREFREILHERLGDHGRDFELVSAADLGLDDPKETGTSFEENSLIKARAVSDQTGLPAVADDSGLIVDVLGRAPGILSARWSGKHGDDKANMRLLLAQLADIPDNRRTAKFVCVATLVIPAGIGSNRGDEPLVVAEHGTMTGVLAREPRGTNGFGYDPIFIPDDQPTDDGSKNQQNGEKHPLSTAELTAEQKDAISHRGKAMRKIAADIDVYLGSAK